MYVESRSSFAVISVKKDARKRKIAFMLSLVQKRRRKLWCPEVYKQTRTQNFRCRGDLLALRNAKKCAHKRASNKTFASAKQFVEFLWPSAEFGNLYIFGILKHHTVREWNFCLMLCWLQQSDEIIYSEWARGLKMPWKLNDFRFNQDNEFTVMYWFCFFCDTCLIAIVSITHEYIFKLVNIEFSKLAKCWNICGNSWLQ